MPVVTTRNQRGGIVVGAFRVPIPQFAKSDSILPKIAKSNGIVAGFEMLRDSGGTGRPHPAFLLYYQARPPVGAHSRGADPLDSR
jgi:hypothetical protein